MDSSSATKKHHHRDPVGNFETPERKALMSSSPVENGGEEDEDSDVENNVSRLRSFLSQSEDDDEDEDGFVEECDTDESPVSSERSGQESVGIDRNGLENANNPQNHNQQQIRKPPQQPAASANNRRQRQIIINPKLTNMSSHPNLNPNPNQEAQMKASLHQHQNGGGSYHRRMGKPVLPPPPHDFLNIPPPSHPPDQSPTLEQRPMPPQRKLPPVPSQQQQQNPKMINGGGVGHHHHHFDEPHYEEAKPPPPPNPRPSKMKPPPGSNGSPFHHQSFELSSNNSLSRAGAHQHHQPHPSRYQMEGKGFHGGLAESSNNHVAAGGGGWDVLEQNVETGSFYIPSGHTTMSSLSPQSQKMEAIQNKHNYSLLPGVENNSMVMPIPSSSSSVSRPESQNIPSHHLTHSYSTNNHAANTTTIPPLSSSSNPKKPPFKDGKKSSLCCSICSWRCLAYLLAIALLFSLAVISYLLVSLYSKDDSATYASYYSTGNSIINQGGGLSGKGGGRIVPNSCAAGSAPPGVTLRTFRRLPRSFSLGDPVVADLPPGILSYTHFTLQQDTMVQLNLTLPPSAKLVLYGRQTLEPTPTQHDFMHIISADKLHQTFISGTAMGENKKRLKRAPAPSAHASAVQPYSGPKNNNLRHTVLIQYLLAGRWHLGFLNDADSVQTIQFAVGLTDSNRDECKYKCYGKGSCKDGKCYCFKGYTGAYCEETICPVLCSGNGVFAGGVCHCHQEWKGMDCDIPSNVCPIPNCNGHGHCDNSGNCQCDEGWGGEFCADASCKDPTCSGNGACVDGECFCHFGWRGESCEEAYTAKGLCPGARECDGNGFWNTETGACQCNQGWTGDNCQFAACPQGCGNKGTCGNGVCHCQPGWAGDQCQLIACLPGCEDHGRCQNGTCICDKGWDGRNCQLEGCPNSCNGRGECRVFGGKWRCLCSDDFAGTDCSSPLELDCSDGYDNDNDGLTDCEDSECCLTSACSSDSQFCQTVSSPHSVLMKLQPPLKDADFSAKVGFLLEPDSVQKYPDMSKFNKSRMSVIRGRVVNGKGGTLVGVRVTDKAEALIGFTISRAGGMFDFVVNGGGSATLQFMRKPFQTTYKTIPIGWNQIIRIPDVFMYLPNDDVKQDHMGSAGCVDAGEFHRLQPFALPSWKASRYTLDNPQRSWTVMADSEAVQHVVHIPGTSGLSLNYFSALSSGYKSTIGLFLVPDPMPVNLRLVKLKIDIQGILLERTLEAQPNLTFTHGWDKRNVYRQKVYGLANAKVSVGYKYSGCDGWFWEESEVKLNGHQSGQSDVGGWTLNVHHHFDSANGVLERGDGSRVYLGEESGIIKTVMGTDTARPLECSFCNGPVGQMNLFEPTALATGPDGSLFVGDHNLIRKLSPKNNSVHTVLQLSPSDTSHGYYMAVNPVTGKLHVSLPLRRQIWEVVSYDPREINNPESNYRVSVGTGVTCRIGQNCGDGGPVEAAGLTYPKGLAFDSRGQLYIADGRSIRLVTSNGLIQTLIGNWNQGQKDRKVMRFDDSSNSCKSRFKATEHVLEWPTSITVNRLTDHLLILDGSEMIYELDAADPPYTWMTLIIGAPSHCQYLRRQRPNDTSPDTDGSLSGSIKPILLNHARAIQSDMEGRILVAESDGKRIHRVRRFNRGHQSKMIKNRNWSSGWTLVAGKESKCECHPQNCPCTASSKPERAIKAHLHLPAALAVDPTGTLYIADQGNLKIRKVGAALPNWNVKARLYEIESPSSTELYYFNRFGQHKATKNLLTGDFMYNFTYHIDSSLGKLVQVIGSGGQRIYFMRKPGNIIDIETSQGRKSVAHTSVTGMMSKFVEPDGSETTLNYDTTTGLITSRIDPDGRNSYFDYDYDGHLTKAVSHTGQVYEIENKLEQNGLRTRVTRNGLPQVLDEYLSNDWEGKRIDGSSLFVLNNGGSVVVRAANDSWRTQLDATSHPLLAPHQTTFLKQKITLPSPTSTTSSDSKRTQISSRLEWRFYVRRDGKRKRVVQVGKKARVNGVNLLAVEYDRTTKTDTIRKPNSNEFILRVYYDGNGLVKKWEASNSVAPMLLHHNILGQLTNVSWTDYRHKYEYDKVGRLTEEYYGDEEPLIPRNYGYETEALAWPSTVQIPSGPEYQLKYDSQGRLESVQTPMGQFHQFETVRDLALSLFIHYYGSIDESKEVDGRGVEFVIGSDDKEQLRLFLTPDPARRVTFVPLHESNMIMSTFDGNVQTYSSENYHMGDWMLMDKSGNFVGERTVRTQGPLVIEMTEKHQVILKKDQPPSTSSVHLVYEYDEFLRPTTISLTLNGVTTLEPFRIDYVEGTGRIQRLRNVVIQHSNSKIRLMSDKFVRETILDAHQRPISIRLLINGRKVAELGVQYSRKLIGQIDKITDSGLAADYIYRYDTDGRLKQMTIGSDTEHEWIIEYDLDGRLQSVNSIKIVTKEGDPFGRITSRGTDLPYTYDQSGSIIQRGRIQFMYDSFGRLIRSWTLSSAEGETDFDIGYVYDEQNRLVIRTDNIQSIAWHFYYARFDLPYAPTHVYRSTAGENDGTLTTLDYDTDGHLFALQRDGYRYFVMTQPDGSPRLVFGDEGQESKSLLYDPFGQVIRDSAPGKFDLFIGWKGGIQDPNPGILIFQGRPYDPLSNRWMSITLDFVLRSFNPYHPETIDPYRFDANSEGFGASWYSSLEIDDAGNEMAVSHWMKSAGVNLPNLLPLFQQISLPMSPKDQFGRSSKRLNGAQHIVSLGIQSFLGQKLQYFRQFLTESQSKVTPRNHFPSQLRQAQLLSATSGLKLKLSSVGVRYVPKPNAYGQGVLLTKQSRNDSAILYETNVENSDPFQVNALLILFNLSTVLPCVNLQPSSNSVISQRYFLKPDSDLGEDLRALGITSEPLDAVLTPNLNVTQVTPNSLRVASTYSLVTIYYQMSRHDATINCRADIEQSTEAKLWSKAAFMGTDDVTRQWSASELAELKANGNVDGYSFRKMDVLLKILKDYFIRRTKNLDKFSDHNDLFYQSDPNLFTFVKE